MLIQIDKEASILLTQLSDWACKYAGVKAVELINQINKHCQFIEASEKSADLTKDNDPIKESS